MSNFKGTSRRGFEIEDEEQTKEGEEKKGGEKKGEEKERKNQDEQDERGQLDQRDERDEQDQQDEMMLMQRTPTSLVYQHVLRNDCGLELSFVVIGGGYDAHDPKFVQAGKSEVFEVAMMQVEERWYVLFFTVSRVGCTTPSTATLSTDQNQNEKYMLVYNLGPVLLSCIFLSCFYSGS